MKLQEKNNLKKDKKLKKFVFRCKSGFKIFDWDTILYFKAEGSYARMYHNGGNIMLTKPMTKIEICLPGNFCRIHETYIINIDNVSEFKGYNLTLRNNLTLPIAKSRKRHFMKSLNHFYVVIK